MSIRTKLAVLLVAAVAAATSTAAGVFIAIERRSLHAAEEEKVSMVLDNVRAMASESQLARDPLMILDYLSFLDKEREDVLFVRVRRDGSWMSVPGSSLPRDGAQARRESVRVAGGDGRSEVFVEVFFSRRVLDRRYRAAERALVRDLGWTASSVLLIGLVLCVPLSGSLTSRLVAVERAMSEVGSGRAPGPLPVSGSDEIARLARGLEGMARRLRELDEMKKTFVASVTHELRSPLFSIESYVKILLKESKTLGEPERAQLARIQDNAARLAHFVSSLLDMARIESGKLDYRPRATDLAKLIEDSVLFHQSRALEGGKTLSFRAQSRPPVMRVDPDLIGQVVTNLVSNALKFTPRGGRVEVRLRAGPDGVECAVCDDGPGIAPEVLARLFRPFERGADPFRAGGTGLGLSIARAIVEMHRGRIWAESTPGKGSRFLFLLPAGDNISLTAGSS